MADTLLPGDFVLVNIAVYKISTPREVPIVGLSINSYSLINIGKPAVNDLVLIKFPSFYPEVPMYGSSSLIKRVVAGPGDTLYIIDKRINVNGSEISLPETVHRIFDNFKSAGEEDEGIYYRGSGWNSDNYGPVVIPSLGDTIIITNDNINIWQNLIVLEQGEKVVRIEGSVITISGKPVRDYIIKKDHYFVIGDNFNNSHDSRYFGFINEDIILGKIIIIYWSMDEYSAGGTFFSKIRWDRMFKVL